MAQRIELSWSAAVAGSSPIDEYRLFKSVNGGSATLLTTIPAASPLVYTDLDVDGDSNTYSYHVIARDTEGTDGPSSNIETLPFFRIAEDGRPREVQQSTDRRVVEEL